MSYVKYVAIGDGIGDGTNQKTCFFMVSENSFLVCEKQFFFSVRKTILFLVVRKQFLARACACVRICVKSLFRCSIRSIMVYKLHCIGSPSWWSISFTFGSM